MESPSICELKLVFSLETLSSKVMLPLKLPNTVLTLCYMVPLQVLELDSPNSQELVNLKSSEDIQFTSTWLVMYLDRSLKVTLSMTPTLEFSQSTTLIISMSSTTLVITALDTIFSLKMVSKRITLSKAISCSEQNKSGRCCNQILLVLPTG